MFQKFPLRKPGQNYSGFRKGFKPKRGILKNGDSPN
ncbi:hypothetical protein NIES4106_12280 [Fischerella sp. NIES-4106]|nr:hypothetical protein NIES4106_12280 [Fischerella sp. NIES-4106]